LYRRTDGNTQRDLLTTTTASSYLDRTGVAGVKYFYSVSTDNGVGESSACGLAASEAAVVDVFGSPCSVPGVLVASDPDGDQAGGPVANSDVDIESISVAEPYDSAGAEEHRLHDEGQVSRPSFPGGRGGSSGTIRSRRRPRTFPSTASTTSA
jgi:hypothetical protein